MAVSKEKIRPVVTEQHLEDVSVSGAVCPICSDKQAIGHYQINGMRLKKCSNCGLVFMHPLPSKQELEDSYQEGYFLSDNHLEWGYEDYFQMEKEVRETARLRLPIMQRYISGCSLLEVGCATGWFLDEARQAGFEVQGVELSKHVAYWGLNELSLPIFPGTLKEAGFDRESFQAAALWCVLEHLTDPVEQLTELNRVLKKGGYVFISVPDIGSHLARIMGKRWPGFAKIKEHPIFFNKANAALALRKSGFEVIGFEKSPYLVSYKFLADKVFQYNKLLARLVEGAIRKAGWLEKSYNFDILDMLVIARKPV